MSRPLSAQLQEALAGAGARERLVARALLRDYPISALTTVAQLADAAGTSTATVLRLVRRLGFASYVTFQDRVKSDVATLLERPQDRLPQASAPQDGACLAPYLGHLAGQLAAGPDAGTNEDFQRLVALVADPRRQILWLGGRYGRHIAALMADTLGHMRPNVVALDGPSETWGRWLPDIGARSVVIAVDIRRYHPGVDRFCTLALARGAQVARITDRWCPDNQCQIVLRAPTDTPSPMDGYALVLALCEALIGAVAQESGSAMAERLSAADLMQSPAEPTPPAKGART